MSRDVEEYSLEAELADEIRTEQAERWARHSAKVAATGFPSLALAKQSPARYWAMERSEERVVYLVRGEPGIAGGFSFVRTGDLADVDPALVGHMKVRRLETGLLRVAVVLLVPAPTDVLVQLAQAVLAGHGALLEVVAA